MIAHPSNKWKCHELDSSSVASTNDGSSGGFYCGAMTFTTTKEATMKSLATQKLFRLTVALGTAGTVFGTFADSAFAGNWLSDERLKRDVRCVESPLEKLRAL